MAVRPLDLLDDGHLLDVGSAAAAALQASCEDVASSRSPGALELTWASEWPTRAQWGTGQRWGWWWVPQ